MNTRRAVCIRALCPIQNGLYIFVVRHNPQNKPAGLLNLRDDEGPNEVTRIVRGDLFQLRQHPIGSLAQVLVYQWPVV